MNDLFTLQVNYDPNIHPDWASAIKTKVENAIALLNQYRTDIDVSAWDAIGRVKSLIITASSSTYLGATSKNGATLSEDYVYVCSPAWLASLMAHEGQHGLNHGKYSGENLWRDEQSAGTTQLNVGEKIGFSSGEIQYLTNWISEDNKQAMQEHMLCGYKC